jgi:hypothetical protein
MFDLTDHQLATLSSWAEVAILLFMVWEKYGPSLGFGRMVAQASHVQSATGVLAFLRDNKTVALAIVGLCIVIWLNLRHQDTAPIAAERDKAVGELKAANEQIAKDHTTIQQLIARPPAIFGGSGGGGGGGGSAPGALGGAGGAGGGAVITSQQVPSTLSADDIQFRTDLRKFILSPLALAWGNASKLALLSMQNGRDPNEPANVLFRRVIQTAIAPNFDPLINELNHSNIETMDISKIQEAARQAAASYYEFQDLWLDHQQLTHAAFDSEVMKEWLSEDSLALAALKNLKTYPVAGTAIKSIQDDWFLSSNHKIDAFLGTAIGTGAVAAPGGVAIGEGACAPPGSVVVGARAGPRSACK